MGVDRTDYLMWGVKLECDKVKYDNFEDEIDGAPTARFDMIYDGMSGEYAVAGKIISRSGPYEGLGFREIKASDLPSNKAEIVAAINGSGLTCDDADFRLYIFSHFS